MSAVVTREDKPPRWYVAWCEECQDGVRFPRAERPTRWADGHNAARHLDELEAGTGIVDGRT
ncbi:hypothetical protein SEA_ALTADENA_65 [Arthrobacter phage Altadena]|uniref:Uncharacterized protein n=1 Tax=Arthrobacter phage Altadena TaxID=3059064 RepID=A0AA96HTP9_9CAUD|nr:hypothetical protein SEA_ALTADENA_65 [Arthrobacter phage Altadena]